MKTICCLLLVPLFLNAGEIRRIRKTTGNRSLLQQAKQKETQGDLFGAIALLESGLKKNPRALDVQNRLYALNKKIHLSAIKPAGTVYYTVRPGDNLSKIAAKFSITPALLMRLNTLKNDRLKVGQQLKAVKGPFDLRIIKKTFTLQVLRKGKVLFTYRAGIGKAGSTPTGTYPVGPKLKKPTQFDREKGKKIKYGSKDHTLGTRWITFSGQYGIHGTVEPKSIGKAFSQGCVRLLNTHVEEVFDMVVRTKSKVIIVESLPRLVRNPG